MEPTQQAAGYSASQNVGLKLVLHPADGKIPDKTCLHMSFSIVSFASPVVHWRL